DPEGTVAALSAHGVETLYLQSATYRFQGPIRYPDQAGRFLDAAHAAGIRVVAWYVPDFADLRRDFEWSMAAVNFTSPAGERFDSFALDIEVTAVTDPTERANRLLELSRQIRAAVGPSYPLGAITPSPLRSPGYWPVFPDAELAQLYDVYLPMAYWSYHSDGERGAYDYIARSAQVVRAETGRPDMPIHMIGGLADGAEADESRGFVDAVNAAGLIGASLYDAASSGSEDWTALMGLTFAAPEPAQPPTEPEEDRGLTLGEDLGTYGTVEGVDRRFEDQVTFEAPPMPGSWEIDYEAFGFDVGRGSVEVNGDAAGVLPPTGDAWGPRGTILILDEALEDDGPNRVSFVREGGGTWGVRDVTASGPALPLDDRLAHGAIPASDPGRTDRVTYVFDANASPIAVTVRGFDVARGEVAVSLDGTTIGWLPSTQPRVWGSGWTIVFEPAAAGSHRLTFDAHGPAGDPWAVRLEAGAPVSLG
ncbi:MAG: hypothetical protein M3135_03160, partial [Actinomycetota bacterium]|nr:hypothetical protein [Actinomycetota bacterium]